MKKIFLLIATFLIFQIKSTAPADFLNQAYAQIDKDKYQDVKELLTKNIDSLTVKNINQLLDILNRKKTLGQNIIKQNSGWRDLNAARTFLITTYTSALGISIFGIARFSRRAIIYYLENKPEENKEVIRSNIAMSTLCTFNLFWIGNKLYNYIYNGKKAQIKRLIKQITDLESYLQNQLVILNQKN